MPQEKDLNYNPRKNDTTGGEIILIFSVAIIISLSLTRYFLIWVKNVGEGIPKNRWSF